MLETSFEPEFPVAIHVEKFYQLDRSGTNYPQNLLKYIYIITLAFPNGVGGTQETLHSLFEATLSSSRLNISDILNSDRLIALVLS